MPIMWIGLKAIDAQSQVKAQKRKPIVVNLITLSLKQQKLSLSPQRLAKIDT